jgi:ParB family chromosome partitioning protein
LAPLLLDEDEDFGLNREIEITKIDLPPKQPRRYFDPEKMQELVASIKQHGVLEPILLRLVKKLDSQKSLLLSKSYQMKKPV